MDEIVKQFEIISKIKNISIVKGDPENPNPDFQATMRFHSSHTYNNLQSSFSNQVDKIYAFNYLPTSTDLQNNLNNLIKAMILLIHPPKQYLQFKHARIQSRTFDQLKDEYSEPRKVHTENSSILTGIYNELTDIAES
jgi:hypothetical protein